MASFQKFTKDPDANLDFSIDWTDWLDVVSDTISSVVWTVPSGITKTDESNTTTVATIWLSGGTVGTKYAIVGRITTAAGRVDDRTIEIVIKQK